ncbi:TVP38/TMEM64 family protein [Corynebacterium lowii]|uniref:TVP38/TMEM64 family membrane protein n=1 Tax=Corynebacterium lowii TaxID=1544413 RepID=A0A0Q0YGN2_9CORY|nr:TVP38/TMEM64 family protein [Corynebacterium lowii]KQB85767.1 SNARE associated Golgi protein [Corynebacterium lowii]MDP9851069.1 putative membrane protein YdjX (TVP38/TMEM64 family) [Corynebacterium lowii]
MIAFLRLIARDALAAIRGWSWAKRGVVLGASIAFIAITAWVEVPAVSTLRDWAEQWGAGFPLLFWTLYVGITQFPVPRTMLTLASGILFGPWWGLAIALSATAVSALISLLIVRGLLGEWIKPRLRHPAVAKMSARLEQRGWLAVGSLRLIAGIPFSLLNYVAALSPVPVLPFVAATAVGSAPGTAAIVLLGDSLATRPNPALVVVMVLLAGVGVAGVVMDRRLPVKAGE